MKSLLNPKIRTWLIFLLIVALPFERLLTFDLAGYTVKISYIVALVFLIVSFFQLTKRDLSQPVETEELFLFSFVILALASTFWSIDQGRSVIISTLFLFMALLFFFLRRKINQNIVEKSKIIFIWLGVLTSLFALWQFFGDSLHLSAYIYLRPQYQSGVFGFPRVQSTFLEPLYFANFLLIPLFFNLYQILHGSNAQFVIPAKAGIQNSGSRIKSGMTEIKKRGWVYYLTLLIIGTAFFLTLSRGAFIALIVGLFVILGFIIFRRRDLIRKFLYGTLVLVGSLTLATISIYAVANRTGIEKYFGHAAVSDIATGESVLDRKYTMDMAFNQFLSHPFGIGAGAFGALPEFSSSIQSEGYQTVNNLYLEVLVEEGFLGLILLAIFFILYLRSLLQESIKGKVWSIMGVGLVAAFLVQYLFFSTLYIIYIWVVLAILMPKATKISN